MSLLMEALRKAEEAKSKAAQKENETLAKETAPEVTPSPMPDQVPFESKLNPGTTEPERKIETQSDSEKAPVDEYEFYSAQNSDIPAIDLEEEKSPAIEKSLDVAEEKTEEAPLPIQSESALLAEHHSRNSNRNHTKEDDAERVSINALFQAKRATQKQRLKKLSLIAALLLLFPLGGGVYWYYSSTSGSQYPTNVVANANRGFLGDEITQENVTEVEEAPIETLLGAGTESIEESIIPEIEEPTTSALVVSTEPIEIVTPVEEETNLQIPVRPAISFTRTVRTQELDPELTSAYANYKNGNYSQALSQYQDVLSTSQNDRDALLGLASVYRKQGNTLQARSMYSQLLRLNPRDPLARAGLLELTQSADPLRQESELKSLLELHPDVAPLAFALGNLYAAQNRWNEAQSAYFDASITAKTNSTGPVSPDYPFNLAVSLERLNQLRPAYNYYMEAFELSQYSTPGFDPKLLTSRLEYLEQALP